MCANVCERSQSVLTSCDLSKENYFELAKDSRVPNYWFCLDTLDTWFITMLTIVLIIKMLLGDRFFHYSCIPGIFSGSPRVVAEERPNNPTVPHLSGPVLFSCPPSP